MQNVVTHDAMGQALYDCFRGEKDHYIIERDDGYMNSSHLTPYFAEFGEWSDIEKRMPEFVHGHVLDVGCGAGRHTLHLQNMGFRVTAIDNSPMAIEVATTRGVKEAHCISVDDVAINPNFTFGEDASFDSIVMMGHNIGLLHGAEEGKNLLKAFHKISTSGARIIGSTREPGLTKDRDHISYQQWNLERGRMRGQVRFRIRHRKLVGEWLDYLFLSPNELEELADSTGWKLENVIRGNGEFGGESYLAVLLKQ